MITTNKIYHDDAKNLLKSLPNGCVDLVVTDPPYKTISGGKPKRKGQPSGMLSKNDGKIFEFNDIEIDEWIPEVFRVLKDNSHCYIFTNLVNLENFMKVSQEAGFKIHNLLVWEKNNVTPNKWYMKNCEYVLFLRKGKPKFINNLGSKTVHKFNNVRNKLHPTEKPIDLLSFYICNSSNESDVVLDPFVGSGSTAIASIRTNRRFIACEIDKKYFDIAKERIEAEIQRGN